MNNKGTNWTEVLFIIVLFLCLVVPFAIFKLWWWFWFLIAIAILFGVVEAAADLATGRTLSQKFWDWSTKVVDGKKINVWKAWLVLGCMMGAWIMLLIHLAWKMIK